REDLSGGTRSQECVLDLASTQGLDRPRTGDGGSCAGDEEAEGGRSGHERRDGSRRLNIDTRRRGARCWAPVKRRRGDEPRGYDCRSQPRLQGERFSMKRRSYGRDAGLSVRMLLTTSLLGLLYVVFAVVLFEVLNVGLVFMLVIIGALAFFQYFTSDKLALKAAGAKIVERDQA